MAPNVEAGKCEHFATDARLFPPPLILTSLMPNESLVRAHPGRVSKRSCKSGVRLFLYREIFGTSGSIALE